MWIATTTGAVNSRHVIRVEQTDTGSILHLVNGQTVKTPLTFEVVDGQLKVIEPDDDVPFDDDNSDDVPF